MPCCGLNDAHMREPVPHHGYQLVDVADLGGDQQGAIRVRSLLLPGK